MELLKIKIKDTKERDTLKAFLDQYNIMYFIKEKVYLCCSRCRK